MNRRAQESIADALAVLEDRDPAVRAARDKLDRTTAEIVAKMLPDTFESGYRAALIEAIHVCDGVTLRTPDNRHATDPRATYRAGASKCAWELRQRLNERTGAAEVVPQRRRGKGPR